MKKQKAIAYSLHILRSMLFGSSFLLSTRLLQSASAFDVRALRFLIGAGSFLVLVAVGIVRIFL